MIEIEEVENKEDNVANVRRREGEGGGDNRALGDGGVER